MVALWNINRNKYRVENNISLLFAQTVNCFGGSAGHAVIDQCARGSPLSPPQTICRFLTLPRFFLCNDGITHITPDRNLGHSQEFFQISSTNFHQM